MNRLNEKGYVLLVTIFTLILISVLGLGLMSVSSNSLKTSTNERASQSVFYLAEAGINYKQAILLEEINKIYTEEKNNPANKTGTVDKFEATFTQRLQSLLNTNAHTTLDENFFIDQSNGKPKVEIAVTQQGSPRKFTITSTGKYENQSSGRTVKRSFEISNNLLTINAYEVPITNTTSPSTEPNIVVTDTVDDYRTITAKASIEDVFFSLVPRRDQNANFTTSMSRTKAIWGAVTTINVRELFKFGQTLSAFPTAPSVTIPTLNTSSSATGTLPKNGGNITLTSSMNMPTFNNFTNRVYNIHVPSGEHTIYFKNNFLNYNLASVRFNVTGNGKLNIVFEKTYELNLGRKFIVNAPSTEVNVVFKGNSTIKGEFAAQNVYIHNSRFEPTGWGKIIVGDIYLNNSIIDKDLYATVNAKNIYGKNSQIYISSPTLNSYVFYANNITLEGKYSHALSIHGSLHLEANADLVVKNNIFIKNADLTMFAPSCLQAKQIVVPNGNTKFHSKVNYATFYGKYLEMLATSETNKNKCAYSTTSISPVVQDDTPQTKTEYEYNFKGNGYIVIDNLVEIKP